MHELSMCGAIINTVNDHAQGAAVRRVNLVIGHFRQVVPETLQFCWEMSTENTPLEECELHISAVPATIVCARCAATSMLADPILVCANCDSTDVSMTSGDEFLIESIDLLSSATASKESN